MIMFRRPDWQLFASLDHLGQKAGVPRDKLARVVVKEAVDNGLDASPECEFGLLDDKNGFFVRDWGDGIHGTNEEIAELYSINRPLTSSKLIRMPRRGQLGNGNRVITGAVAASDGSLGLTTCGRKLSLVPNGDGCTKAILIDEVCDFAGTRLEVTLGPDLPLDEGDFVWANFAVMLAGLGSPYKGHTSAWWYSSTAFYELLQAAGETTIRNLIEEFDRCSGANAGRVAAPWLGRTCNSLSQAEADELLRSVRAFAPPVDPKRLGKIGQFIDGYPANGYYRTSGTYSPTARRGELKAEIPFVIEAWANVSDEPRVLMHVNRTPITSDVWLSRTMKDKATYGLHGCGLNDEMKHTATPVKVGQKRDFQFLVNLCSPFIAISTDGKEPNLSYFAGELQEVLQVAARRARARGSSKPTSTNRSKKQVIIDLLPEGIRRASKGGQRIFSQRHLFYKVRPMFEAEVGEHPKWNYFCQVITGYEESIGEDVPGMYRDDRGVLYHPHTGETIPLGSRSVAKYSRPEWSFNKIVYIEKEGLFETLIHAKWPERHDCALLTSKGYASRAARDLIDLLGGTSEEITFFAVHDADGPGTVIFQSLTEATRARPGRKVRVENLGLEPEEGKELGLPTEPVERKDNKRVPVANYVSADERRWLQKHRIELDAIPDFIEWLDSKIEPFSTGKLIPPARVLKDALRQTTKDIVRKDITERVLREADVDGQVEKTMRRLNPALKERAKTIRKDVASALTENPVNAWTASVADVAKAVVKRK